MTYGLFLAPTLVLVWISACGTSPRPAEAPTAPSGSDDAVVQAHCAGCHARGQAPRIATAADLRRVGSDAAREVRSGDMPPGRTLPADEKAKLLAIAGGTP